jgi:hypothetical protein
MPHTIKANRFFVSHFLTVESEGITFQNTSVAPAKRHFAFPQIACVLMSPENVLSFQVQEEVFTIPVSPDNPHHKETIDAMVAGLTSVPPRAE